MFSIILSCVTKVPVRHGRGEGSVIAAFFLAHNYVSEQFGNYVEYGTSITTVRLLNLFYNGLQQTDYTIDSRFDRFE